MEELSNVLWIGGPAGAGKTTVGRLLARRHGLRWYNQDTRTWVHRDRALAAGIELPARGPGSYDRTPMIVEDLRSLPTSPLVVAEGGAMTPAIAKPKSHAVWLVPSQEVQRARLEQRHPAGAPPGCLRSWHVIVGQLGGCDVNTITVDNQTVDETIAEVERLFGAFIAEGPKAVTIDQRRELVRYGNQALVTQYLSPLARPITSRDPEKTIRIFDCECATPSCDALVELSVSDAAAALETGPPSILATGCLQSRS